MATETWLSSRSSYRKNARSISSLLLTSPTVVSTPGYSSIWRRWQAEIIGRLPGPAMGWMSGAAGSKRMSRLSAASSAPLSQAARAGRRAKWVS